MLVSVAMFSSFIFSGFPLPGYAGNPSARMTTTNAGGQHKLSPHLFFGFPLLACAGITI